MSQIAALEAELKERRRQLRHAESQLLHHVQGGGPGGHDGFAPGEVEKFNRRLRESLGINDLIRRIDEIEEILGLP